ncbi:hypothetical protein [Chitinophaga sp.]|uniref:M949_RS01915 family surface polysaccharide biosynthesis protein n=1 Tax=Chitinophaga sp. TaxID=1869181 RepID=UPI0031E363B3
MKQITITLFALFIFWSGHSQTRVLIKPEVDKLFPESVQQQLGLKYPIRLVYNYADKTGDYYMPLCESVDSATVEDTLHWKIKAVNLKLESGVFSKVWELNDHILTVEMEESIWFFTKYTTIKDLDGDGVADPVMIYGSSGENGVDDGRMKILIYYKGKKVAIRHQNSVYDGLRKTEVDKEFYELPDKVQTFVKGVMNRLEVDNHVIYASGWLQKMNKKMTKIE